MRLRSSELAQPKPALPLPVPGARCPAASWGFSPSCTRRSCRPVGDEETGSLAVVVRKSSAGLGFAPKRRKGSWMCFRGPSPHRAAYVGVRPLVPGLLRWAPRC